MFRQEMAKNHTVVDNQTKTVQLTELWESQIEIFEPAKFFTEKPMLNPALFSALDRVG